MIFSFLKRLTGASNGGNTNPSQVPQILSQILPPDCQSFILPAIQMWMGGAQGSNNGMFSNQNPPAPQNYDSNQGMASNGGLFTKLQQFVGSRDVNSSEVQSK